ncbi:hypothetical protein Tco_1073489, partial [Tanacetum coccineum]
MILGMNSNAMRNLSGNLKFHKDEKPSLGNGSDEIVNTVCRFMDPTEEYQFYKGSKAKGILLANMTQNTLVHGDGNALVVLSGPSKIVQKSKIMVSEEVYSIKESTYLIIIRVKIGNEQILVIGKTNGIIEGRSERFSLTPFVESEKCEEEISTPDKIPPPFPSPMLVRHDYPAVIAVDRCSENIVLVNVDYVDVSSYEEWNT